MMNKMEANFGSFRGSLDDQKEKLVDDFQMEFTKQKLALGEVVSGAQQEFKKLEAGLQTLYQATEMNIIDLGKRLQEVEGRVGG